MVVFILNIIYIQTVGGAKTYSFKLASSLPTLLPILVQVWSVPPVHVHCISTAVVLGLLVTECTPSTCTLYIHGSCVRFAGD